MIYQMEIHMPLSRFLEVPEGYQLEHLTATTYSLGAGTFLSLAVCGYLASQGDDLEDVQLQDIALQEKDFRHWAKKNFTVFSHYYPSCSDNRVIRDQVAAMADCCRIIRPNQGVFHPKLLLACFNGGEKGWLYRLQISSRNLVAGGGVELAIVLEGKSGEKKANGNANGVDLGAFFATFMEKEEWKKTAWLQGLENVDFQQIRHPSDRYELGNITFSFTKAGKTILTDIQKNFDDCAGDWAGPLRVYSPFLSPNQQGNLYLTGKINCEVCYYTNLTETLYNWRKDASAVWYMDAKGGTTPFLHAKMYYRKKATNDTDTAVYRVALGSANASENGLERNVELLVMFDWTIRASLGKDGAWGEETGGNHGLFMLDGGSEYDYYFSLLRENTPQPTGTEEEDRLHHLLQRYLTGFSAKLEDQGNDQWKISVTASQKVPAGLGTVQVALIEDMPTQNQPWVILGEGKVPYGPWARVTLTAQTAQTAQTKTVRLTGYVPMERPNGGAEREPESLISLLRLFTARDAIPRCRRKGFTNNADNVFERLEAYCASWNGSGQEGSAAKRLVDSVRAAYEGLCCGKAVEKWSKTVISEEERRKLTRLHSYVCEKTDLTSYQQATVDHLAEVFEKQDIYLVADEVGLGKTYVAKGLIQKMNFRRVIYIASNPEIAKQNAGDLGGVVIQQVDRLSRLGATSPPFAPSTTYILPLSPVTSFTGIGSKYGDNKERESYFEWYQNNQQNQAIPDAIQKIRCVKQENGTCTYPWDGNEEAFGELRKFFCERAVELLQPDLIIMDEFHRFSKLLDSTQAVHFSLQELVNTANAANAANGERGKRVKILLLSATPYVIKPSEFKREYEGLSSGDNTDNVRETDDQFGETFQKFEQLTGFMSKLSGIQWTLKKPEDYYQYILCRTERKWLQGSERDVPCKDLMAVDGFDDPSLAQNHLSYRNRYLDTLCFDENAVGVLGNDKIGELAKGRITAGGFARNGQVAIQNYSAVRTYLDEAPEYAQFADGYVTVTRGGGSKGTTEELRKSFSIPLEKTAYRLKKRPNSEEQDFEAFPETYGHAKWDVLREAAMPEGAELRLWVPPTVRQENFSKTMVFAHYRLSTRAVAALTSMEAQRRLAKRLGARGAAQLPEIPLGEEILSEETLSKLAEPALEALKDFVPVENFAQRLRNAIRDFFSTTYARTVLWAWNEDGVAKEDLVERYCEAYGWDEMIKEYIECCFSFAPGTAKKGQDAADKLVSVLSWTDEDRTRVLCLPDWRDQGYPCTFGERYTSDYSDKKAHDSTEESDSKQKDSKKKDSKKKDSKLNTGKRLEHIRDRFQSPFYPFVLAASETAQEGVNLHNYCATVFQWSVPSRLNTFIQEMGRIDRRASLTLRRQAVWVAKKAGITPTSMTSLLGGMDRVYQQLNWDAAAIRELKGQALFPHWFLPAKDEWLEDGFPQLQRYLFHLPMSRDELDFQFLLEEQRKYRTFGLPEGQEGEDLRTVLCPSHVK